MGLPRIIAGVFVLLTLVIVAGESLGAVDVLVRDGAWAVLLLVSGCGWGLWPMSAFQPASGSRAWTVLGATALGLGGLAAGGLVLGCAGIFAPAIWWGVILVGVVLGVTFLALKRAELAGRPRAEGVGGAAWVVLILAPFLALGILSASTPPGVLWVEEGFGYDVLEYHLGLPKEYFVTGRIAYLPHNVYANFPANIETLYLWTMVLRGDPWRAAISAKLLNLLLGALAVWACWLAGREFSRRSALPAAVLAGGAGWLVYLSGVAYVENGMMLFGALSVAATPREPPPEAGEAAREEEEADRRQFVGRRRLLDICAAGAAVAVALTIFICFKALWAGLRAAPIAGPKTIVQGFITWAGGLPRFFSQGAPAPGDELSIAGHVVVAALLVLLALRALFRTHLLDAIYAPEDPAKRPHLGGLIFHLLSLAALLGLVAWAAFVLELNDPSERYLVGWLMTRFVLASAGWYVLMRVLGRLATGGLTGRMWNNGLCGVAAAAVLLTGGVPRLPMSGFEQCVLVMALNSLIALCLVGAAFAEKNRAAWARRLGFLFLGAIMVGVAAVVFLAT